MSDVCRNCRGLERERDIALGELGRVRFRADRDIAALRAQLADAREELAQRREYMRRGIALGRPTGGEA